MDRQPGRASAGLFRARAPWQRAGAGGRARAAIHSADMSEPESFGFDALGTLAHVGSTVPASRHSAFWRLWREMVLACKPRLRSATPGDTDPDEPDVTHVFESVRHARIGCRLIEPPDGRAPRACLITTHGYAPEVKLGDSSQRWESIAARGVAVLLVRVRGYPGSTMDTGPIAREPTGWVTHGLPTREVGVGDLLGWVYPLAVADVVNACRAAAAALGAPIWMHGESLGGGLGVTAAAHCAPHCDWSGGHVGRAGEGVIGPPIERLALGLPTMGDWPWRRRFAMASFARASGSAGDVRRFIAHCRADEEAVYETLRLADSVVHARHVLCPTACKLALRDEVVPAPSAAAVFNALRSDPGRKWRFIVRAGHAEVGLANARRHALFERMLHEFFDPDRAPEDVAQAWERQALHGERAPTEAPPVPSSLFEEEAAGSAAEAGQPAGASGPRNPGEELDASLLSEYERLGRTLDDLAYTPEFDELVARARGRGDTRTERQILHRLMNLRKAARLPRVGRGPTPPVRIDPAHERLLRDLVVEECGAIGVRDQLPYSPEFDRVAERFNAETGLALGHHSIWRLIAKVAK